MSERDGIYQLERDDSGLISLLGIQHWKNTILTYPNVSHFWWAKQWVSSSWGFDDRPFNLKGTQSFTIQMQLQQSIQHFNIVFLYHLWVLLFQNPCDFLKSKCATFYPPPVLENQQRRLCTTTSWTKWMFRTTPPGVSPSSKRTKKHTGLVQDALMPGINGVTQAL